MKIFFLAIALFLLWSLKSNSQGIFGSDTNKIKHPEPLANEFTTDLGARKHEATADLQLDYIHTNAQDYDRPVIMLELEYAPVRRLGLAVRLPYDLYVGMQDNKTISKPMSSFQSLEWSLQYTFYTSEFNQKSWAIGYRNRYVFQPAFENTKKKYDVSFIAHEPYLVFAKNFGEDFSLILQAGAQLRQPRDTTGLEVIPIGSASFYYELFETSYLGLEMDASFTSEETYFIFRPEWMIEPTEKTSFGIAIGIPEMPGNERWDALAKFTMRF
jgi:hypothetical protein